MPARKAYGNRAITRGRLWRRRILPIDRCPERDGEQGRVRDIDVVPHVLARLDHGDSDPRVCGEPVRENKAAGAGAGDDVVEFRCFAAARRLRAQDREQDARGKRRALHPGDFLDQFSPVHARFSGDGS